MCKACHRNSAKVPVEGTGGKIFKCLLCLQHFDEHGGEIVDADKAVTKARQAEDARKKAEEEAAIEASHQGLA